MSTPGWYPDPGGAPGRFRFWDGARWSAQTTANPHSPTPARVPARNDPQRSGKGWIVALAVLVALTLIAVAAFWFFGLRGPTGGGTAVPDENSSSPTVPQWDETSTPTPPPPNNGGSVVACPITSDKSSTSQVSGKLTADTLQVDQIDGWDPDTMYLDFTYDGHWQSKTIYQTGGTTWESNIGVALLSADDDFTDISTSAEQVMECLASSDYYKDFSGRVDISSAATTIAGHAAWHIESEIHVNDPDFPKVQGDVVDVIVVDLGSQDHLGLYMSCYTIGDTAVQQQVQTAMATLTVIG